MASTWNSGLCDCCAPTDLCLDTYFCWPCMISRQKMALQGNVDTFSCLEALVAWCCCPLFHVCQVRSGVVAKYNIDDGCTCCKACLCPQCSLCQTHRELTARGTWPGGVICVSQPYTPPAYKQMA